ncbi:MBL fold metallo-hydrolase [Pyramidobacter piscolens]|uniref:MBL fold metallo-hydrolase n=1 Tax=Pyramidobacter piscolens TaxID=638849 RepID=UPI002AB08799|nr:MBL fold metallo-hydrolase [Pyramidobacter piscolens]
MNYKRIPLGPLWTNSYVIDDGRGTAFCIDAGGDPADVLGYLRNERLKLAAIVLTHCHMDHILGCAALKKATGAVLYAPADDEPLLADPNRNLAGEFGYEIEAVQPDRLVRDGDVFSVGGISLTALHTPGHTPGSTCYVAEQDGEKLLVSGDTLFARSIGRTDLTGGDREAMSRSLARLNAIAGDMPVLPGHGPETTLQKEREWNPFLKG